MADLAELPFFTATGNYRGVVPDTLDIGYRPDEFRPWAAITLTPKIADAGDRLLDLLELRLVALVPPVTVMLVPTEGRIETGVVRFGRLPAPAGDAVPPTPEEVAEQQAAEGIPLLAMGPELELATGSKLVYRVDFGPMTMLGRSYTYNGFYFEAPVVDPATLDATIDLTTVTRWAPAAA